MIDRTSTAPARGEHMATWITSGDAAINGDKVIVAQVVCVGDYGHAVELSLLGVGARIPYTGSREECEHVLDEIGEAFARGDERFDVDACLARFRAAMKAD